jgi:hypothetical protein
VRATRLGPVALLGAGLALLVTCAGVWAPEASAQEPERAWAVIPMLGGGRVREEGGWNSAGAEAALELEYGGSGWRWSGYASQRGLGVGCSESCFDGGPAFAAGIARSFGRLWLGGGAGVMKDFGAWRRFPYGRASFHASRFRFDVRFELPDDGRSNVYIPILIGIPLPRRTAP